jgi:hypothetical protein
LKTHNFAHETYEGHENKDKKKYNNSAFFVFFECPCEQKNSFQTASYKLCALGVLGGEDFDR